MLGGLALAPVKYWMLRSWRTYALLGGAAVLVVLAEVVALKPLSALQTGLVAGMGSAMILRNEPLWAMSRADRRFVDAYAAIRTDLKTLRGLVGTASPAEYQRQFSELIARLEGIEPPSLDWAALKNDTVKDLQKRLWAMRANAVLPEVQVQSSRREWKELEDRFVVVMRRKTSFWLPWP